MGKWVYGVFAAIGTTLSVYFYYIKSSLSKQKDMNKQLEQDVIREKNNVEMVKQVNQTNTNIAHSLHQAKQESNNVQKQNQTNNDGNRPDGKFGDGRLRK